MAAAAANMRDEFRALPAKKPEMRCAGGGDYLVSGRRAATDHVPRAGTRALSRVLHARRPLRNGGASPFES